ncbi:stage V sporulation protein AA [Thalassobacillus sp. CUG 92003]|uniref:stage V sporulation protein AA n=1 Tax=Thalassobacillus sp. CUG 92003 TaxID=2736641 RepID=UPI00351A2B99
MPQTVYIRLKQSVTLPRDYDVQLKDVALVTGPNDTVRKLNETGLHHITAKDKSLVILDGFFIIDHLLDGDAGALELDLQLIGPSQCIVRIQQPKMPVRPWLISGIWILLFVGAAMAIMNFHYDVSMESVQQKLHFMLTGEEAEHPLWIQVPYSIGLGTGMILFFNHIFKKKFNEEPSPMEIEVFNYQQDLNRYVSLHENKVEKHDDSS